MITRELFSFSPPCEDNNPSVGSLGRAGLTLSPLFPSHLHQIRKKRIKFMVLQDLLELWNTWIMWWGLLSVLFQSNDCIFPLTRHHCWPMTEHAPSGWFLQRCGQKITMWSLLTIFHLQLNWKCQNAPSLCNCIPCYPAINLKLLLFLMSSCKIKTF